MFLTDNKPFAVNLAKEALRATLGATANAVRPEPCRFVIFTNGRTGSNLLVSLLKEHPKIRVHSEIFGEYQLEDPRNRKFIRERSALRHYQRSLQRLGFEDAVGLKIIYYQLEQSYGEARGVPDVWRVRDAILADEGLRFIHLKRQDFLSRVISNRLALASGNWEGGAYAKTPIEIDVDWVRSEFERMEEWERQYDADLPADRTLQMTYEDFTADIPGEMKRVFEFLDVPERQVTSAFRRQNTRSHRETIRNYDALRAAFEGTPFDRYFPT